eukprot:364453-Chlamydomonas_euryale.AAC.10
MHDGGERRPRHPCVCGQSPRAPRALTPKAPEALPARPPRTLSLVVVASTEEQGNLRIPTKSFRASAPAVRAAMPPGKGTQMDPTQSQNFYRAMVSNAARTRGKKRHRV